MSKNDPVTIRSEKESDRLVVRDLVTQAFGQPAEADLIDRLRRVCPEAIMQVAEVAGAVVGHICFSPVTIDGALEPRLMGLAPVAVVPSQQRLGIGGKLIRHGLGLCRNAGYVGVILLGHPAYYPRFGFERASNFGLTCEFEAPDEAFLALELKAGAMANQRGIIHYHKTFREL